MEYSIVIPAFNEADKITRTLTEVLGFMKDFCDSFEIIVVDDGSSDNTVSLVEKYIEDTPGGYIKLIKNPHKGKGASVWSGVMAAEGDYINMCDADLATPISELKRQSVWLKDQGFDLVISSREGKGAVRVGEPFFRHFIGRVFNLWVQAVALPGIQDTQTGFKTFKKHAAKEVFGRLSIYGSAAKETKKAFLGAFDVEVLFIAKKLKFKIKVLPITWTYVKTTRLNFFETSLKMARDVVMVRLNDIRGKYDKKITTFEKEDLL